MVTARAGKGTLGCLMALLLVVTAGYFAVNIGQTFWDYIQFRDRMRQEARFAQHRSDTEIMQRLSEFADSLGLPEAAQKVHVRRRGRTIQIWAEYYENIELPLVVREHHFTPQAVGTF